MLKLIERFQWPLTALAIALGAALVLVFGFGDALGIDPEFRATLSKCLGLLWISVQSTLLPALLKDSDGDGKPDIIDDSITPPPLPSEDA